MYVFVIARVYKRLCIICETCTQSTKPLMIYDSTIIVTEMLQPIPVTQLLHTKRGISPTYTYTQQKAQLCNVITPKTCHTKLGYTVTYIHTSTHQTFWHRGMGISLMSPIVWCPESNEAGGAWSQRGQGPPRNDTCPVETEGVYTVYTRLYI